MHKAMEIKITGKPIAKKRPRFARRGKFVTTYSDQQVEESRVLYEIQKQLRNFELITAPINVSVMFYVPRPKGHYGTGKKYLITVLEELNK